jgi:hypothetical protein
LEPITIDDLLEGVAIAVPPSRDDAAEGRIHEHANRIDAAGVVNG